MLRNLALILPVLSLMSVGGANADVFNMGGTRDLATGTWTGQASLEFVTVGDAGNTADPTVTRDGTSGYGSVPYVYRMGKYEVTLGQYCQFLNAVGAADTYGLYNSSMATDFGTLRIARTGSSGNYAYTVTGSYNQAANCPITYVSWGDAARFCNWVENGQPTGPQGLGTTETGAYTLNGATTATSLMAIKRSTGAHYFIPSENEWHKAAYYKGSGTNAGYWTYPTQNNSKPSNILSASAKNNANFLDGSFTDPTNRLTPVGAFAASPGPYGTFDMGGDVFDWTEGIKNSSARVWLGSGWNSTYDDLASYYRDGGTPTYEYHDMGFRMATVALPGDANADGAVNTADLSILLTNFDETGMTWGQGDFDGNAAVDIFDLSILLSNFGRSQGASAVINAVPEPSTTVLIGIIAICMLARAWPKRRATHSV
jgi:formylglycine-generating enzyme